MTHPGRAVKVAAFNPQFGPGGRQYSLTAEKVKSADVDVCCVQGVTARFAKQLRTLDGYSVFSTSGLGCIIRNASFSVDRGHEVSENLIRRIALRLEEHPHSGTQLPVSTVACRVAASVPVCAWCLKHVLSAERLVVVNYDFSPVKVDDPTWHRTLLRELCFFLWEPVHGLCARWECSRVVLAGYLPHVLADLAETQLLQAVERVPVDRVCEPTFLPWSLQTLDAASGRGRGLYMLPPRNETDKQSLIRISGIRAYYPSTPLMSPCVVTVVRLESAADTASGAFLPHALCVRQPSDSAWYDVSRDEEANATSRTLRVEWAAAADASVDNRLPDAVLPPIVEVRETLFPAVEHVWKPDLAAARRGGDSQDQTSSTRGEARCAPIIFTTASLQQTTSPLVSEKAHQVSANEDLSCTTLALL